MALKGVYKYGEKITKTQAIREVDRALKIKKISSSKISSPYHKNDILLKNISQDELLRLKMNIKSGKFSSSDLQQFKSLRGELEPYRGKIVESFLTDARFKEAIDSFYGNNKGDKVQREKEEIERLFNSLTRAEQQELLTSKKYIFARRYQKSPYDYMSEDDIIQQNDSFLLEDIKKFVSEKGMVSA